MLDDGFILSGWIYLTDFIRTDLFDGFILSGRDEFSFCSHKPISARTNKFSVIARMNHLVSESKGK